MSQLIVGATTLFGGEIIGVGEGGTPQEAGSEDNTLLEAGGEELEVGVGRPPTRNQELESARLPTGNWGQETAGPPLLRIQELESAGPPTRNQELESAGLATKNQELVSARLLTGSEQLESGRPPTENQELLSAGLPTEDQAGLVAGPWCWDAAEAWVQRRSVMKLPPVVCQHVGKFTICSPGECESEEGGLTFKKLFLVIPKSSQVNGRLEG